MARHLTPKPAMRRSRRLLIWVLAVAALWSFYWLLTRNRLTITNESGQDISGLTVDVVGDETIHFGDLAAGKSASAHFRIYRNDETWFEVRCRLADGTQVHEWDGYVVWEEGLLGVNARLTIRPEGLTSFTHR